MSTGDILLVDDDPDLLKLISLRLTSAGYRVRTADSGETALAALAVARPGAVITDLRMPGIDGLQLFEAIHRQHPALPVIILTAHGTIPDAVAATQRGVFGFLTKPFDSQELLQKVAAALAAVAAATPADGDRPAGRMARRHHHAQPADGGPAAAGAAGRRLRRQRADLRRIGHRQGAARARDPPRQPPRGDKPFVAVNCGAIPEPLLESELFGHARGAFTRRGAGAQGAVPGRRRRHDFLDEIGDMPLPLQVKLLRVLQEGEVRPVGATQSIPVDVRVISATHRDLDAQQGERASSARTSTTGSTSFRCKLPPLAERREDIPLLATHFLRRLAERYKQAGADARARRDGAADRRAVAGQRPPAAQPARAGGRAGDDQRDSRPRWCRARCARTRRRSCRSRRRASSSSATTWCGCSRSPAATSRRRRSSPSATAPSSTSCCSGTGSSRRCSRKAKLLTRGAACGTAASHDVVVRATAIHACNSMQLTAAVRATLSCVNDDRFTP